jgi:hypothetical protein
MMKGQTKHLTGQVREALLALPDIVLMETLARWLDGIDEQRLDWSDECRSALGYRIQSDETHKIYASFEELEQAEPEGAGASWMAPDAQTLRTILGNLSIEQFYHTVIALASEALALQASEEAWGPPPSVVWRCNRTQISQQQSHSSFSQKQWPTRAAPPRYMLLLQLVLFLPSFVLVGGFPFLGIRSGLVPGLFRL